MKIRTRLTVWYAAMLLTAVLSVLGWACYEMFVEHATPHAEKLLTATGEDAVGELLESFFIGTMPALIFALIGGWFLMRRALSPVSSLTGLAERIHLENLGLRLPDSGNNDEMAKLATVFNAMLARLDNSFTRIKDFTLHASHELKTPLTVMRLEIESTMLAPDITPAQKNLLAGHLNEIQRMAKIVDALTLLAKADSGLLTLDLQPVRLDLLVRECFEDVQMLAMPQNISATLSCCDEVTVRGDSHRLRQLLLNLVDNALKYNHPRGQVNISLTRGNGFVELQITNTGEGIPPDKLPRIFDRFYRCDPAHGNEIEGSGLGLSIVDWIAKAHRGTIQISSEPGRLTTAKLKLPIIPNERNAATKPTGDYTAAAIKSPTSRVP